MPAPSPTAQTPVELVGGPYDGETWHVPEHCAEFYGDHPDATQRIHYRYCPHASARLSKTAFIHAQITHDLYAR